MTTNVYDEVKYLLTSDTRWSTQSHDGEWIGYVDDTGYNKIIYDTGMAFLFAGGMEEIDKWKQWIRNGRKDDEIPIDPLARISVLAVNRKTGYLEYSRKALCVQGNFTHKAWFAGTGGDPAKVCWTANRCARRAIDSAALKDPFTGGNATFANRKTGVGNVKKIEAATVADVRQQLKDRGILMHRDNAHAPMLLKDSANDPNVDLAARELASSVMSGSASLSAPFPGMDKPLSPKEIALFRAAMLKNR